MNILTRYIAALLLIVPAGSAHAQETMRIPLNAENESVFPVRLDGVTLERAYLIVGPQSRDGRGGSLELGLNVTTGEETYRERLHCGRNAVGQPPNDFPKAVGRYLLDLDIREDGADLLIRPLKFGDRFIVDTASGRSTTVETLSISCESRMTAQLAGRDGGYGGYETAYSFRVSNGRDEKTLRFAYIDNGGTVSRTAAQTWNGYTIEMPGGFEPPELRVSSERRHRKTVRPIAKSNESQFTE